MLYRFYALAAVVALAGPVQTAYTLTNTFAGSTFFNNFSFFTATDPTAGTVSYVPLSTALQDNYVGLVNGTALSSTSSLFPNTDPVYIGSDHTTVLPNNTNRDSIRISSTESFTHGLFVVDVIHAPTGCGTWPSIWFVSTAGAYPGSTGEIDLFEGVNDMVANSMTLHTDDGCSVANKTGSTTKRSDSATGGASDATTFLGTLEYGNCFVDADGQPDNTGCSIIAPETVPAAATTGSNDRAATTGTKGIATAGTAFNAQGGGVYALYWTSTSIQIYLFPRDALPTDLQPSTIGTSTSTVQPNPASWATTYIPLASFSGCDFDAHLGNLSLIINTDFCGSWAGAPSVWESGGCAKSTGVDSCAEFVDTQPEKLAEAFWVLGGVQVWQDS